LGRSYDGANVFDFAPEGCGTIAAGLKLSEISMGGLGTTTLRPPETPFNQTAMVCVATDHPLLACIASQYAGWPLGDKDFFAMCSGPARAIRGQESILKHYDLVHRSNTAVGVLETDQLPSPSIVADFANQCSVEKHRALLCVAPTSSLPGSIQVVSRSVETALHKLHELKFDLRTIKRGTGAAPLPPIAEHDLLALGRANDAILYGAVVTLWVDTTDQAIEEIVDDIPSLQSPDYGVQFLDVFERYGRDFYKIDPMLFSPAEIVINNVSTGQVFRSGAVRTDIVGQSFGIL
jgi:methenyltetrahydromethanopterin cyclohydrolase